MAGHQGNLRNLQNRNSSEIVVLASEGLDLCYENLRVSVEVQHYRVKWPFARMDRFVNIPIVKSTVWAAAAAKIGKRLRKGFGDGAFYVLILI